MNNPHPTEHRTPAPERDWKDKWEIRLLWFALLATAIAAVAAVFAALFTKEQVKATEKEVAVAERALEAQARAWVVPGDIVVPKAFVRGDSNEIHLSFGNVGQRPALNVTSDIQHFIVPSDNIGDRQAIDFLVEAWTDCDNLKPTSGFILPPTGKIDSRYRILPRKGIKGYLISTEQSLKRRGYFMVAGCFAYETFGKPRIYKFCRFLDYNEGNPPTPDNWPSTFCNFREFAN